MTVADRWLLPDGIEEILPPRARRAEALRREMLDLFDCWGYDLVIPPHLEFLESLTAGVGHDLELQIFKVTDLMTGRTMGLRADTTPAVARIDAHNLTDEGPVRLCYEGSVFHAQPASLGASRSPIQLGAELYGHAGPESDIEVISLMLETLSVVGIDSPNLDLGHVQIYRALVASAGLDRDQEQLLFDALQRKATCEVEELLAGWHVDADHLGLDIVSMFKALASLSGKVDVIAKARDVLVNAPLEVFAALDALENIAQAITRQYPKVNLYLDLGELRGYNYHNGVVFAAYVSGHGQAIAKGGRYDGVGRAFGRARPATGFSTDLKALLDFKPCDVEARTVIFAPADVDSAIVRTLRQQGLRVIIELPGQKTDAVSSGCNQQLAYRDGDWQVEAL
ncbi:ATP phosphoribosyltransferase regulatory subunit [Endozoicomonas montiporae]|uniref:ATP phosphoribosyltransferase regulatory subunit n=2 Tax=Endozoicomonas montiporae TaxID=1027273 RepID=A0A081MZE1_9GAMM|nr:ATP phosphoribosyltransferase regulatory subunit [Endozoicomonas montiporae]AMO54753.1 ATP phosphoribosyltransferase regulatory subunit [Endozoicomonas montiporae CL-33]KEQ11564.1 ATP phosphoribosyltransferase regulatory subunit [Endozoicomonas montiporae]